jgi:hypothetical protein
MSSRSVMKSMAAEPAAKLDSRWVAYLYTPTLLIMALTGFGQMPLYSRYYLSDLPGLGWLGDFYLTRNIHYIGGILLLALISYLAFDFLLDRKRRTRLKKNGWLRGFFLGGIVISGAFIVVKNFPYVVFSDGFIIGLNLLHLGTVMALLVANLVCLFLGKRWVEER